MKKLFVFLLVVVAVVLVVVFVKPDFRLGGEKKTSGESTTVDLVCDRGYEISATYSKPDANGVMTELSLSLTENGAMKVYTMAPIMSASGARFGTPDMKYTFWEHQGTFTFAVDDVETAVCHEKENVSAVMTEDEARAVAQSTCVKEGEMLGQGMYNENTGTWWFDATLTDTKPGCNPACVVSEDSKTAEINWRCTGLLSQ